MYENLTYIMLNRAQNFFKNNSYLLPKFQTFCYIYISLKIKDMAKDIKFYFEHGEYAEHLLDSDKEVSASNNYSFQPIPPITITEVIIHQRDDYNGHVYIMLSNEHEIEYECVEIRGNQGPDCKVEIHINGVYVGGNNLIEEHLSMYGTWVPTLMNIYEDWFKKNNLN